METETGDPMRASSRSAHRMRHSSLRLVVFGLVVLVIAVAVVRAIPPHHLVIETGPVGGSYYADAKRYQAILATRGISLQLQAKPKSLEIADDVAEPQGHVDVGFIAQDVSALQNKPLYSIGQIELQPLFIFATAELGRRTTLGDLRGRSVVMPPKDSATSDAAIRLFKLYDITPENTRFTFMPLDQAVKDLQAGRFDAGAFMLTAENASIRSMMMDSGLHLVAMAEARAIATHLPFLQEVRLPRGIYDIADAIPPTNVPLIAAPVSMVVREGLHPFLLYALMDAMTEVHRGATFISTAGEFPTSAGSQLTIHPLAAQYFRTGVPWTYRALPPWLASFIDEYQRTFFVIILIAGIYFGLKCLAEMVGILAEPLAVWIVRNGGRGDTGKAAANSERGGWVVRTATWWLGRHHTGSHAAVPLMPVGKDEGATT